MQCLRASKFIFSHLRARVRRGGPSGGQGKRTHAVARVAVMDGFFSKPRISSKEVTDTPATPEAYPRRPETGISRDDPNLTIEREAGEGGLQECGEPFQVRLIMSVRTLQWRVSPNSPTA